LFFNGFLEEIRTAIDRAVTDVTTVEGSVERFVAMITVVVVIAVNVVGVAVL